MYKAKNGTHRGYKNTEKGYNEFIGYVTFSEDAFMEIEVKVNDFGTIDDQITLSNVNEGEYTINFPRDINLNEKTVLEIQQELYQQVEQEERRHILIYGQH